MESMRVLKRNGVYEEVSFDKVIRRIKSLCVEEPPCKHVDYISVAQKVCSKIFDGVSTSELDELAANTCISLSTDEPEYGIVASRIIISNNHKNTPNTFVSAMEVLYNQYDSNKKHVPIISEQVFQLSKSIEIEQRIDYRRDYLIDYFGFKTLEKSYLKRVGDKLIERPQHMWMRVALGIHGNNLEAAFETYDAMSLKQLTHATPTLFHSGTPSTQFLSCFLLGMDDSIDGIYKCISDCAKISKWAGGIGFNVSKIRSRNALIRGTNGKSDGIVPMLKVFNDTALYVNQSGKRNGSFAVYLEPWHPDIFDFLDLKKNHGDESSRCRDLFYAVWLPDLFMERVDKGGQWSLMDPDECPGLPEAYGAKFVELYERYEKEGRYRKQVAAQEIFNKIIEAQIETGTPYIGYKDSVNRKSNQKNLGTIMNSNLCVAPETLILTKDGYKQIKTLSDQEVEVWNGENWSKSQVKKTGENQLLMKLSFDNGSILECTEYHKFYLANGSRNQFVIEKRANELRLGDKLEKFSFPIIETGDNDFRYPYTHGLFCADGTYEEKEYEQNRCSFSRKNGIFCMRHQDYQRYIGNNNIVEDINDNICCAKYNHNIPKITLYQDKIKLAKFLDKRVEREEIIRDNKLDISLPYDLADKYLVPINKSVNIKLRWLEGYVDGDGCLCNNEGTLSIQFSSTNRDFITNIGYLLNSLGCNPKFTLNLSERKTLLPDGRGQNKNYDCKPSYRMIINTFDLWKLFELGFSPKRLNISNIKKPNRDTSRFIRVSNIEITNRYDETYCFNEPIKHKGIFNGILTGNCHEICEYSDHEEYACCTLGSLGLPAFISANNHFDFESLAKAVKILVRNLNIIIDKNYYPVPETKRSNFRHRPIGIGVQGLADVYMRLRLPFDSSEASQLNKEIFATIYYSALEESLALSIKKGEECSHGVEPSLWKINEWEAEAIERRLNNCNCNWLGAYSTFEGSPISQGQLQFDLWDVKPLEKAGNLVFNWEQLRKDIMTYGVRNSLLVAPMPTASTSQILGNTECFEPITSNIYVRRVLAGDYIIVNRYLVEDLKRLGLWNRQMKELIILHNGSIQSIETIPKEIRNLYKTSWDLSMKAIIDQAADRGAYICQTQSMNLFMAKADFGKIRGMHFYAWRKGLKTGIYYLRTLAVAKAQQVTIDPKLLEKQQQDIPACRRDNPDCLVCSS